MLPAADIESVLIYAVNRGYIAGLAEAYAGLPEKECADCTKCCDLAPRATFTEYLNTYSYLREQPKQIQGEVLRRTVEFFFLELADPGQRCPFNDPKDSCLIRPVRPLQCRLFGLLSQSDYEEAEQKRIAQIQAIMAGFRDEYDIELPPAILIPRPYCDRTGGENGSFVSIADADMLKLRLISYDGNLVAPEHVFREVTYLPLPVHLAMTVLNPGIRGKRVEVIREFLQGSRKFLDKYAGRAESFRF
ncbi:MAG: YkgJ family cysteine cluster protein [Ammonifex sp.]|jgi:Fe-S-cluster containining protein|nr:MAG: YkgJ family cysteine cluster protein [Ammonifex sp.]